MTGSMVFAIVTIALNLAVLTYVMGVAAKRGRYPLMWASVAFCGAAVTVQVLLTLA